MMFGVDRLIVGTSGSPGSLQALRYGEGLALAHNAVLIPVIAWELPGGDRAYRIGPAHELGKACQEIASRQLRDALTAVWGEVPGDPLVQPRVERGAAGWVLVNLACRPGDVLAVGAGRRGPLGRLMFSRVSRYCLAHARCPVIAVPPPDLVRELGHGRLTRVFWRRSLTPEQILGDHGRPAA
jgi:nucleotide-binding universal stress UspA family protein